MREHLTRQSLKLFRRHASHPKFWNLWHENYRRSFAAAKQSLITSSRNFNEIHTMLEERAISEILIFRLRQLISERKRTIVVERAFNLARTAEALAPRLSYANVCLSSLTLIPVSHQISLTRIKVTPYLRKQLCFQQILSPSAEISSQMNENVCECRSHTLFDEVSVYLVNYIHHEVSIMLYVTEKRRKRREN